VDFWEYIFWNWITVWELTNGGWDLTNVGWEMTNFGWKLTNANLTYIGQYRSSGLFSKLFAEKSPMHH
jgi:hypothetical protein